MKLIRTIFWWIFVFSIPVLLITAAVKVEIGCLPFYQYQYEKNYISQVTGFTNDQLMNITRHLIQFFAGKNDNVQLMVEKQGKPIYLFHDYEIVHLNDVKLLFGYTFQVLIVALVCFFLYLLLTIIIADKKKWYYFWSGLRTGNILTIALLLIFGSAVLFGFHSLFTKFHYLVFGDPQNSPWLLDPRTDHLVMMYPLSFWQDSALLGVGLVITTAFLLILISSLALYIYRNKN